MNLKDKLDNLPQSSGVYIFRDELDRIIYVGKAKNLRNRVRSYFHEKEEQPASKSLWLRKSIADLEYILVNSPLEALILEANLIKRHRPFFNIRMKDDKSYPCIEITVFEDYPRMRIVRRTENKKSRYFGPYSDSSAMRRVFKLIQKIFMIRTCKYDLIKPLSRPCLDFHINLCTAPCTGYISKEEYSRLALRACDFLDGKSGAIIDSLKKELLEKADALDFERCIYLRNVIKSIELVTADRPMVTVSGDDGDFIGIAPGENFTSVCVLQLRDGKVMGYQPFILKTPPDREDADIPGRFIMQYYREGFFIPPRIFLSATPEDTDGVSRWLSGIRGRNVSLKVPQRGSRHKLLKIAEKNAQNHLSTGIYTTPGQNDKADEALLDLKNILGMDKTPERIEGYDISNISGTLSVGSMVVFIRGEPYRSHYRRFRIKTEDGPDDFAMMNEVMGRRLKNLKLRELESFRSVPDLIMIDGGKGQLSSALQAAREHSMTHLNFISLAKKEEEIYIPGRLEPIRVSLDSPGLKLLMRVRDEAHRFAVSYHRNLRSSRIEVSILDSIPGVSKKRKEILLKSFDSIQRIRESSLYELEHLPGFNRKVAENVLKFLGNDNLNEQVE